jgi:hypothetical protein
MNLKIIFTKLILALITLSAVWWIATFIFNKYSVETWLFILLGVLTAMFLAEAMKAIDGQRVFWSMLSTRDKFVAFTDFLLILLFGLVPLKKNLPIGFTLFFVLLGYGTAWLVAKAFGSDTLRKVIFSSSRKNSQDS